MDLKALRAERNGRGLRRDSEPRARSAASGFSLIELMGVLAIAGVLAAVVTANVLEQVRQARRDREGRNLTTLERTLRDAVLRVQQIPSATNWTATVAAELTVPASEVSVNDAGNARALVVHPAAAVGTNANSTLPYTQTALGSRQPQNARAVLVSSTAAALPVLTGADFASLWNLAPGTVPGGWGADWNGHGEDLHVQRVDFSGLFHRLILSNRDPGAAPYSLDPAVVVTIAASSRYEAWFLDGTAVNLHYGDGTIQATEILHEDTSYVYENGRWGRFLMYGQGMGSFGQLVEAFLNAPAPPSPRFGSSQQAVVDEFYTFLRDYGIWATDGFPKGGSSSDQQVPSYRVLNDCQARLDTFTYNLVK